MGVVSGQHQGPRSPRSPRQGPRIWSLATASFYRSSRRILDSWEKVSGYSEMKLEVL